MKPGQDRIVSHTNAEWDALNPVLAMGEIGINLNGGRLKYGDGVSPWSALPYLDQNYATQSDITAVNASVASALSAAQGAGGQVNSVRGQVNALNTQMAAVTTQIADIYSKLGTTVPVVVTAPATPDVTP